jgi:type VI secretion system protein ImpA
VTNMDIDTLLSEISTDAPCGEDVSYDVAFMELERLAEGTTETQVGDHIQEGVEPDWKKVYKLSLDLLHRSRDLRLILYLTASALRLDGLQGFRDGLALLRGVVERFWEPLFPQLDPDDDNDPLERMNIIGSLSPARDRHERSRSDEVHSLFDECSSVCAGGCAPSPSEFAPDSDIVRRVARY